jgi:hypothetical protein
MELRSCFAQQGSIRDVAQIASTGERFGAFARELQRLARAYQSPRRFSNSSRRTAIGRPAIDHLTQMLQRTLTRALRVHFSTISAATWAGMPG